MIACQFAAEALQNPGQPCHVKTKKDSSTRQVRKSLREHHTNIARSFFWNPHARKKKSTEKPSNTLYKIWLVTKF